MFVSTIFTLWSIDNKNESFSKEIVLVDFFVELSDVPKNISTLEIKRIFHNALKVAPIEVEPIMEVDESDRSTSAPIRGRP